MYNTFSVACNEVIAMLILIRIVTIRDETSNNCKKTKENKLVKSLIRKMKWLKRKVNVETNHCFSGTLAKCTSNLDAFSEESLKI